MLKGKLFALVTFVMIYVMVFAPHITQADAGMQPVNIMSVRYDFYIEGITNETSLEFNMTGADWQGRNFQIVPAGGGARSHTVTFDSAAGIINLGYVSVIEGSGATLRVERITVNDIELTFSPPHTLHVGDSDRNGLPNIWWGFADGAVIATGEGAQLAFHAPQGADNLFRLYTGDTSGGGSVMSTRRSVDYIDSMGMGWNLGNTLDSPGGTNLSNWETNWGNPIVTQSFINSIAARGYDHIRIPFTISNDPPGFGTNTRFTDRGENTPPDQLRFVINDAWLNRYLEVVQWAYDAGLYVMVNIHHDSWMWIGRYAHNWDGSTDSWQYRRFRDHWTQLAQAFAHFGDRVMFETINEPHFYPNSRGVITPRENEKLRLLNQAAFDIIRSTPGNETRIVVIPTIWTHYTTNYSAPIRDFIRSLNCEHVVATVHYYSAWLFSANLGIASFDERIGSGQSARFYGERFFDTIYNYFISEGIGVNVGEWGLLAYDDGYTRLQVGEELKYYEFMKHTARETGGVNLTFWDNQSGINRRAAGYPWHNLRIGEVKDASLRGERSSYATGLDTIYFRSPVNAGVEIPLTLNGNSFVGIRGLTRGVDYSYNAGVVTLHEDFVNARFRELGGYGTFATLVMEFSAGADWQQFLVRHGLPQFNMSVTGTRADVGINIPVQFNGTTVRRVSASQNGNRVGGNNLWWNFLQMGPNFRVDTNSFIVRGGNNGVFNNSVATGNMTLLIEFFDGQNVELTLHSTGTAPGSIVTVVNVVHSLPHLDCVYCEDSGDCCEGCNPCICYGTHIVIFNPNGGQFGETDLATMHRDIENDATLEEMPFVRRGAHRFVGWYSALQDGERFFAHTPITSSVTLYARWVTIPTNFLLGDTNGDGRVTSADVNVIARILLAGDVLLTENSSMSHLAADVDGDGIITPQDMTLLAKWLMGHDVQLSH